MQSGRTLKRYRLGLQLTPTAIGWAMIQVDEASTPTALLKLGVRVFQPGAEGSADDFDRGAEQSKARLRRQFRLRRRQLRRHSARQSELFELLQANGLLPVSTHTVSLDSASRRHQLLTGLDKSLRARLRQQAGSGFVARSIDELFPYLLRKRALDRQLEPYELGRVFYHLGLHRGFRPNRLLAENSEQPSKGQTPSQAAAAPLEQAMISAGARTLGEYFAGLDPHEVRIRGRWTTRSMYEREFECIWQKQAAFYPELLNAELKSAVVRLLFSQKPLRPRPGGPCPLEPKQRRAPWFLPEVQRMRLLSKVNELEIIAPGDIPRGVLSADQRRKVVQALEEQGDQSWEQLRTLLSLTPEMRFSRERQRPAGLSGNRSNAILRRLFGACWEQLSASDKNALARAWQQAESAQQLTSEAVERWGLSPSQARWAEQRPEAGYCPFSLMAIRRLLPHLEQGCTLAAARSRVYEHGRSPATFGTGTQEQIPPVRLVIPGLDDPILERVLGELRKLVNALVRAFGKPQEIQLGLSRALRQPHRERARFDEEQRRRERQRKQARQRIVEQADIPQPSAADLQKALLFEECDGVCPYTGRSIEFSTLFRQPRFQVVPIIPLSRYPDDSFANLTLCFQGASRQKRELTPWEAFGGDQRRWDEIMTRVNKFNNPSKSSRFQLRSQDEINQFAAAQRCDHWVASRRATDLLRCLYPPGNNPPAQPAMRDPVRAFSGQLPTQLMRCWNLAALLPDSERGKKAGESSRLDYRRHALKAITVALADETTSERLARALVSARPGPARQLLSSPWPLFLDSIRREIELLVVSPRPEHKLSGPLHQETNYGKPRLDGDKSYVHLRVPISSLRSAADIASIVDPAVRQAVRQKAEQLQFELARCYTDQDWPMLPGADGRFTPVRRVRIRRNLSVITVGEGERRRFVQSAGNHHLEVFAKLNRDGEEVSWESATVSLLEAATRARQKQAVVKRSHTSGQSCGFKFSLMVGDTIELHRECEHGRRQCSPGVYRVRSIASNGQLALVRVHDGRTKRELQIAGENWHPRIEALRRLGCRKVTVDLLGRLHPAHD